MEAIKPARMIVLGVMVTLTGCMVESSQRPNQEDDEDVGTTSAAISTAEATAADTTGDTENPPLNFRPARVQVPAPKLNIQALHNRWLRQFSPPDPCKSWRTYRVGGETETETTPTTISSGKRKSSTTVAMPTIGRALEDARTDPSVCGPVIIVAPGRWTDTPLEITKPSIIVGAGAGVVISATIASTRGQPLWMQDVVIDDAPFPGAIVASHWSAETTLVRVHINQPHGIGIIQNGGVFSMFGSSVRRAIAPRDPFADPRVDRIRVQNGFGQPSANKSPTRSGRIPRRLDAVVQLATNDLQVAGPSLTDYVTKQRAKVRAFDPYDFVDLTQGTCSGSGAVFRGGLVELDSVSYAINQGAGAAFIDSFTIALDVGTGFNGITPHDDADPGDFIDGPACVGGIHMHPSAGIISEGGGAIANQPVGVAAGSDSVVVWGTLTAMSNQPWNPVDQPGWGDGLAAFYGSYVSFVDIEATANGRVGILLVGAEANFFAGSSTQNRFGLVMTDGASAHMIGEFTLENNTEADFLSDGPLPVPSEPAEVPE